jgi:ergothioneine biosynthesis protein EgtB
MPDVSPAKWHLAHVTWFFETFVLEPHLPHYEPACPEFRFIFNSYYNAVGAQYPRPQRGLLTRPALAAVADYRARVDEAISRLLRSGVSETLGELVELGLHHEQQHQELLLMDIKHVLSRNPLGPAYRPGQAAPGQAPRPPRWSEHPGGFVEIGAGAQGFAFDNERPRHRVWLEPFALADRLVTNGEFAEFIEDGGYRRPALWLADGWSTVEREGWHAPLYWMEREGEWHEYRLRGGWQPLDPAAPVCHVSLYEADAFAAWRDARLPTEAQWEALVAGRAIEGNFLEDDELHPRAPVLAEGLAQAFGDAWEWTASAYLAYPGFRTAPGAIGEYNGKFMCGQHVLRGGSCVTPEGHVRASYRNFFYPPCRWMFAGIRLARR